mmetsp:Transcript_9724/g.25159  ORF Transcript_9724/g.25159 Transcript_9724/m.25159 type:complete len:126 (+) Transcript_9724:190-567(+)
MAATKDHHCACASSLECDCAQRGIVTAPACIIILQLGRWHAAQSTQVRFERRSRHAHDKRTCESFTRPACGCNAIRFEGFVGHNESHDARVRLISIDYLWECTREAVGMNTIAVPNNTKDWPTLG